MVNGESARPDGRPRLGSRVFWGRHGRGGYRCRHRLCGCRGHGGAGAGGQRLGLAPARPAGRARGRGRGRAGGNSGSGRRGRGGPGGVRRRAPGPVAGWNGPGRVRRGRGPGRPGAGPRHGRGGRGHSRRLAPVAHRPDGRLGPRRGGVRDPVGDPGRDLGGRGAVARRRGLAAAVAAGRAGHGRRGRAGRLGRAVAGPDLGGRRGGPSDLGQQRLADRGGGGNPGRGARPGPELRPGRRRRGGRGAAPQRAPGGLPLDHGGGAASSVEDPGRTAGGRARRRDRLRHRDDRGRGDARHPAPPRRGS
ncbi:hypothetical protein D3C77_264810 [compost metagenome]